jgi:uncharacterized protein (DUF1330 family)
MSAFVIATAKIKDAAKFAEYGQKAGPTIAKFGGELLCRGKFGASLDNASAHDAGAVILFASRATASDWYESPEYQAIIPLRNEAADMVFAVYDAIS